MQNKYPANSSCHGEEKIPQFIMIFELLLSINVMMFLNYPQTLNPISLDIDLKTKNGFSTDIFSLWTRQTSVLLFMCIKLNSVLFLLQNWMLPTKSRSNKLQKKQSVFYCRHQCIHFMRNVLVTCTSNLSHNSSVIALCYCHHDTHSLLQILDRVL